MRWCERTIPPVENSQEGLPAAGTMVPARKGVRVPSGLTLLSNGNDGSVCDDSLDSPVSFRTNRLQPNRAADLCHHKLEPSVFSGDTPLWYKSRPRNLRQISLPHGHMGEAGTVVPPENQTFTPHEKPSAFCLYQPLFGYTDTGYANQPDPLNRGRS